MHPFHTFKQARRGSSPWTRRQQFGLLAWQFAWPLLCGWTPKPFNAWRIAVLRAFGSTIGARVFVHQRARIQVPWHLTIGDEVGIGDGTNLYSLGRIEIGARATVAQEAYLCTGTHEFDSPEMNLMVARIVIGEDAFVGARAFVLPGVEIGAGAIVGACSVVTRDVEAGTVVAGNPARKIGATPQIMRGAALA